MTRITKAVIPAAGFGTRFLPWTKAMPKEMLPVVDRPVIQVVVEECINSGIKEIIIVYSQEKKAIKNYFQPLKNLKIKNPQKRQQLKKIEDLLRKVKFKFVLQKGPYGNATPVLSAQKAIGNQPFAVLWGDQFVWAQPPRLKQCLEAFKEYQDPVIAGMKVDQEIIPSRGMCDFVPFKDNVFQLRKIVEKPSLEQAPSDIAAYGTYVLTPDIFPILKNLKPGKQGEYWLVDAINQMIKKRRVLVVKLKNAQFYDAGNKLNYHKTVIDFMLRDREIGSKMKQYLQELKLS